VLWLASLLAGLTCCNNHPPSQVNPAPPPPQYTGPDYLQGTVGSMCRLRGTESQLVSGYGLIVNLRGTGSPEVPAFLRQWLINEMRKQGVGSTGYGMESTSPEEVLASSNKAVVLVQGLIPPGASKGARFDVLVTALPQTQTTSLDGGQLWTTDLSRDGGSPAMRFSRKLAQATGPIYIDPFDENPAPEQQLALRRQAVVLSGGMVTEPRELELILNQPSWQRSRAISDRINERFPKGLSDHLDTAVATTDSVIRMNIPSRYASRPAVLIDLIAHLYIQRSPNFEQEQAQRLADLLAAEPQTAYRVTAAWKSLGKTIIPILRQYYDHPKREIQLAALEAGAWLEDEATTDQLLQLALAPDPAIRKQAARMLVHLPRSLRGTRRLHTLLDDEDPSVRIAAYESLAEINDPIIERIPVADKAGVKFVLDMVPARKPLIYVAQARVPRLVIFNPILGFQSPFIARLWDNRLMLRGEGPDQKIALYYQQPGQTEGQKFELSPTVADFAFLLAHRPTMQEPGEGLDLTYGQVAGAVYSLCKQGAIDAQVELQISPIATAIAQAQNTATGEPRPETTPKSGEQPSLENQAR
jgi:hypothetical protein